MTRLFDLRDGEGGLLARTFLFLFTLIAAHTILETARDALFLVKLPPERLAFVYMTVAALSVVISRASMRLVDRFGHRGTLLSTLCAAAFGTMLFRFAEQTSAVVFGLYVWSALLGPLLVVQFWMLTAHVFTVAQGKRLLGPIAAGGVLGAVAGASLAAALLSVAAVGSLLLVASGLLVVGALTLTSLDETEKRPRLLEEPAKAPAKARTLVREQPYVKRLALLVVLATAATLTIDYLFKASAAETVAPADLGGFLARYYAALNALALLVQVFLSARIVRRFGVVAALSVMPLLLLAGGIGAFASGGAFLAVLLAKGVDGSLRHSLYRVGNELVAMPLPVETRDRVKPLLDTVLGRVTQAAIAGVILLLATLGLDSHRVLSAMLMVFAFGWVIASLSLMRPYIDLFRQALRLGALDPSDAGRDIDLTSAGAAIEALSSREPATVIASLDVLAGAKRAQLIPGLILYHESPVVLMHALSLFERSGRQDWLPLGERLLEHAAEDVRIAALRAIGDRIERSALEEALRDVSPAVRAHAALRASTRRETSSLASDVVDALVALEGEEGRRGRLALIDAMRDSKDPKWVPPLLGLADSDDPEMVERVALAMADIKDPRFIPALVGHLKLRAGRSAIRRAIVELGDQALDALEAALLDPEADPRLRLHVPSTVARFGTQRAADLLLTTLGSDFPGSIRYKALKGLAWLVTHHKVKVDVDKVETEIQKSLLEYVRLLGLSLALEEAHANDEPQEGALVVVLGLLADKQTQSLDRTFRLLQIVHRHEDLRTVYAAAFSDDKRARANAIEFLDALGRAHRRGPVTPGRELLRIVVDDLAPAERVARAAELGAAVPETFEAALAALINDRDDALAALATYHAREAGGAALREEILATFKKRPALRAFAGVGLDGLEVSFA